MLWVDKYRPTRLHELTYHKRLSAMLKKMVANGNFPHLLLYGPPGAGKKTRVLALLHEVFGKGVHRTKTEHRTFKAGSSRSVELTTLGSNHHIEMNPSDAGIYDRIVVQEVIKEIASSAVLAGSSGGSSAGQSGRFKVVVLNEVDRLTKDAQHGLRRTMEKHMATCRLILQCESVAKVIDPLRSRCLAVRVAAPSHDEIVDVLRHVATKERIHLDDEFARELAEQSGRNLRKALLLMQVAASEGHPGGLVAGLSVKKAPWELFVQELARIVSEEQSPQRLLLARQKLYELLANCIPADVIFKALSHALMENVDDALRREIATWAAYHEHRMQLGSKPIIHLEAFLAQYMAVYKRWMAALFAD